VLRLVPALRLARVGTIYTVGVLAGVGAALGVLAAGLVAGFARAAFVAAAVAAALAGVVGLVAFGWPEAVSGAAGGVLGGAGAAPVAQGTLRRGGTRGGTAALLGLAGLGLGVLALIPGVGYLEALGIPVLAARLRRRSPETYAGLRTLARD
jgi:hypothetical protein